MKPSKCQVKLFKVCAFGWSEVLPKRDHFIYYIYIYIYIYIYDYIVICRVFAEYQHLRESCVDPEDPRFMPLGITLTEAYVMIQGADREA